MYHLAGLEIELEISQADSNVFNYSVNRHGFVSFVFSLVFFFAGIKPDMHIFFFGPLQLTKFSGWTHPIYG